MFFIVRAYIFLFCFWSASLLADKPLPWEDPRVGCGEDIAKNAELREKLLAFQELDADYPPQPAFEAAIDKHFVDFTASVDGRPVPLSVLMRQFGNHALDNLVVGAIVGAPTQFESQLLPGLKASLLEIPETRELVSTGDFDAKLRARLETIGRDPAAYGNWVAQGMASRGVDLPWWYLSLGLPVLDHFAPKVKEITGPDGSRWVHLRAQQAVLAQAVFQFGLTTRGDLVIETGYGNPATLITLAHLLGSQLEFKGMDIVPVRDGINESLRPLNIELFQGNFPADRRLLGTKKAAVICGVDTVLSKEHGLDYKMPPKLYLKNLFDSLDDGGVVVLVNDRIRAPYFNRKLAEEQGFNIIRWDERRPLGDRLRRGLRANGFNLPHSGDLSLFVIRKGQLRLDRLTGS